jgi:methyl-accepting chemotaxis protein
MVNTQYSQSELHLGFFHSMRGTLLALFLAIALIPLLLAGAIIYYQVKEALEAKATDMLIAVRDIKANQIEGYFQERLGDVKVLAANPTVATAMHDFEAALKANQERLKTDETGAMADYRALYLGNPGQTNAGDGSSYSAAHARYHPMFKHYLETYGYYDIFLVEPHSGTIIYTVTKEDDFGTSLRHGKYADTNISRAFQAVLKATGRDFTTLEDFAYYEPSDEPAAFVASLIYDGSDMVGVLIFQLSIKQIDTIMQERAGMGETGETYLVGADKLMRTNSRFIEGEQTTILAREIDTLTANKALDGDEGVEVAPDYRGETVLSAYKPLNVADMGWVILAEVDEAEAFAATQQMLWVMLGVIGLGAVAVTGVALVVANSLARPVMAVTEAARRLALGDVNQTVSVRASNEIGVMASAFNQMIGYLQNMAGAATHLAQGDVAVAVTPQSSQDILGHAFTQMIAYQQRVAGAATRLAEGDVTMTITPHSDKDVLGNAFSQMIANLRTLISQVQESAAQVAEASQQLNTAAEQAGQAGQQVSTSIQQVAQGAGQQSRLVIEASGNVEQMARSSEGIARGAQEQAQGVQKTSDLINDMGAIVERVGQVTGSMTTANIAVTEAARRGVVAVEQSSQGMETIRTRTITAAGRVKEMGTRSKEIGRIVNTIDDIADKTDMLALNAAVEAARAGEYGRGFAVVADQVRKLSEDSKVATRDISDLIERVQETVNEAVMAMDNTVIEVNNGSKLAQDTAKSLQDIMRAAEGAADLAQQIGTDVAQLKQKNEGVTAAIETVSAVVEENTAVAEEMAAGSHEVTAAMEGIASVAEENNAATEEVNALAEEMAAQVEEMVASIEELSALAEELQAATAQFHVEEADKMPLRRQHTPQRRGSLAANYKR